MTLLKFNLRPTTRQLRQFGCMCAVAFPLATWLWTRNTAHSETAAMIGLALAVTGLAVPELLKPLFIGLTLVTIPIGLIVGELAMLGIWFGLFLPMAILFRIIGRDVLQRRTPSASVTFWQRRPAVRGVRKYYQQS